MADILTLNADEKDIQKVVAVVRQLVERFQPSEDAAAAAVPTSTQVISGAGLTGGGDLSADRTLAVGAGTGITVNADDVTLANMAATTVKARGTASTGAPEDIAIGNGITLDATSLRTKQQMSITADSSGLKLSGDASTPGNSKYYGTDSGGTKGFNDLPVALQDGGSGGLSGASVTVTNIPAHTIMFVQIVGASHNSGSNQFLQIELSANNGSSFSAPVQVTSVVTAAVLFSLLIYVTSDVGNTTHLINGDNPLGGTDTTSGEINAVRLTWNGGSFDAGNYRIHVL